MNYSLNELEDLIKGEIPKQEIHHPTYLQISGFPDYENVVSNIYKFFLEYNGEHGLGDLFLLALGDCINRDLKMDDYVVEREVSTIGGGRIDIVIRPKEKSKFYNKVILIENKIYHSIDNPFSKYLDTFSNYKNRIGIILTLEKLINVPEKFINITHKDWIEKVQDRLTKVNINHNNQYYSFLFDFINHINNFYKKPITMEGLDYLFEHGKVIKDINELLKNGEKHIKHEVDKSIIDTKWKYSGPLDGGIRISRTDVETNVWMYIWFNEIFYERKIEIGLWICDPDIVDKIETSIMSNNEIGKLAYAMNIKLEETKESKEWYWITQVPFEKLSYNQIDDFSGFLQENVIIKWEEFIQLLIKTYNIK